MLSQQLFAILGCQLAEYPDKDRFFGYLRRLCLGEKVIPEAIQSLEKPEIEGNRMTANESKKKRVLVVAYDFPPAASSETRIGSNT